MLKTAAPNNIITAFLMLLPIGEYTLTTRMWTTRLKEVHIYGNNGHAIRIAIPHISDEDLIKFSNCEYINSIDEVEEVDFNETS